MRFYELFTHCNTFFNLSDTVIKCFSRCTYINIAISVMTRTGYNDQIRLDLRARCIRFLLYSYFVPSALSINTKMSCLMLTQVKPFPIIGFAHTSPQTCNHRLASCVYKRNQKEKNILGSQNNWRCS